MTPMGTVHVIDRVTRALPAEIGARLDRFGGLLRCERCGVEKPLEAGAPSRYLAGGWPEHCDRAMRWWTQRQLDGQQEQPWLHA